MTTEELKFEMYEQLAALRKARKHPVMLRNFEDDLEAYLEALRMDAQIAREGTANAVRDANDLKELRESAGRLIVRNTKLEERLRAEVKVFGAEVCRLQAQLGYRENDILVWERTYSELWEQLQAKQILIVSQREAIKTLKFALVSVQKAFVKPGFWHFLMPKKNKAKPLPEKMN